MPFETILSELDEEQREAVRAKWNTVVAAGAGSGKTKVLAARYAWFIMEKGYKAEEILTLTFTNTAVSEMYSRIYGLLAAHQENPGAREAIREFHKANISTLDSFCAGIARTAARRYGISPDFVIDNAGVRDLAMEAALPFVLEHRDNPALQLLLADKKIRIVADELFAETVILYSSISAPLDFNSFMKIQGERIFRDWEAGLKKTAELTDAIIRTLPEVTKTAGNLYISLKQLLSSPPATPGIRPLLVKNGFFPEEAPGPEDEAALRTAIAAYFQFLSALASLNLRGNHTGPMADIKEKLKELKGGLYNELEAIANFALQCGIIASVFPLADEFQRNFDQKKREAGILTFNDIARLAVDALSRYPDIRKIYKDSIRTIMVDEFQDNNSLQRDLIFLLAEDPRREAQGIPQEDELSPDKMFFVGDEKQSIYRFRGADVSVFRSLAGTLAANNAGVSLNIIHNYRSKPILINAFNHIFGGITVRTGAESGETPEENPGVFRPELQSYGFEAAYRPTHSPRETDAEDLKDPPVHFCFFDKTKLPEDDPQGLSSYDLEAAFIALRIREMIDSGYQIQVRNANSISLRPCEYKDFAVLERSYTHQGALEKQFKNFEIPYNADRPAGLFIDAPINDLYNLLRLIVYPGDSLAYAALIRSPFTRLSDITLSVCMLHTAGDIVPFDPALEDKIPQEELAAFQSARRRYEALAEAARTLPVTGLLAKLWFNEGYRYETLWSQPSQIYAELFDLFFELARDIDSRGKGLASFLDYLEGLINNEEKLDNVDLPAEGVPGVRLMSIHKSKGLEFPVVFVYACGSTGAYDINTKAVYFNETWGLTLNLPQAEELPGNSGNHFFKLQREEENLKRIAELRRLLYVAMTRAESCLYLTASLPKKSENSKNRDAPETGENETAAIKERLSELKIKKQEKGSVTSFLDLLLPVLSSRRDGNPFTIEDIPLYSRRELRALSGKKRTGFPALRRSMEEAAAAAAPFYAGAEIITTPKVIPGAIPASSLHYPESGEPVPGEGGEPDEINALFNKAGLEAADFGTIVHSFLEAAVSGGAPFIPARILARLEEDELVKIRQKAQTMADGFIRSELGRLSLNAPYREPEFPILTLVELQGKKIYISGQIDLVFESAGTIYIVDFKTDQREEPSRHIGQLAAYERAAGDIFQKPVRSWLFYLRSGNAPELSSRLKEVDLEALVNACFPWSGSVPTVPS
jgi:ATP-dependent helicase/nuclease subunit A